MKVSANNWGALMALTCLTRLPILTLCLALQRQVVNAVGQSGLKQPPRRARYDEPAGTSQCLRARRLSRCQRVPAFRAGS